MKLAVNKKFDEKKTTKKYLLRKASLKITKSTNIRPSNSLEHSFLANENAAAK